MARIAILLMFGLAFSLPSFAGKKASPGAQIVSLKTPFDPSAFVLPKPFSGHRYSDIASGLAKHPAPNKSEFETVAEFDERFEKWRSLPLFGSVTPSSTLAFTWWAKVLALNYSPHEVSVSYDADSETMTATFSPTCRGRPGVELFRNSKKLGSYTAQNAFGAKRVVVAISESTGCLELLGLPPVVIEFSVPRDRALYVSTVASFLVVGKLDDNPVTVSAPLVVKPTIDNPVDLVDTTYSLRITPEQVWVVDTGAGVILAKRPLR